MSLADSPPSKPGIVLLTDEHLAEFDLAPLGFALGAKLRRIILSPHVAATWLDLTQLPGTTAATDLYPAIRRLARMIDEDAKQMGLVVPVVVVIQPAPTTNDDALRAWRQLDADTDLNAGEFAVRLPFSSMLEVANAPDEKVEDFFNRVLLAEFTPHGLVEPVRPRTEQDYRRALLESSAESQTEMHRYLVRECLGPNWEEPQRIPGQLQEFAAALARSSDSADDKPRA